MKRKKGRKRPTEPTGGVPTSNPVAKYARKFNKAAVQRDRKRALQRGYRKHKGDSYE